MLYPAAQVWLAAHVLLPLSNLAWQRASLAAHPADGGSWGRRREVLAACVRAYVFGFGAAWAVVLATFDREEAREVARAGRSASGALPAALNLLNASTAPLLALVFFKPLRLGCVQERERACVLAAAAALLRGAARQPGRPAMHDAAAGSSDARHAPTPADPALPPRITFAGGRSRCSWSRCWWTACPTPTECAATRAWRPRCCTRYCAPRPACFPWQRWLCTPWCRLQLAAAAARRQTAMR